MSTNKFVKVARENLAVITSSDRPSKCAKRKFRRYGKVPANQRSSSSKKAGFIRRGMIDFELQFLSGNQEHLWHRGEEMAKLYNLKRV